MNHKYLYLLLLFLIVSCQRNVETEPPVLKEMCQRLFSRHAQSFLFELLTDSIDTDRFYSGIESRENTDKRKQS